MTIVVALKGEDKSVWMGADSCISFGSSLQHTGDHTSTKIVHGRHWAMASAGRVMYIDPIEENFSKLDKLSTFPDFLKAVIELIKIVLPVPDREKGVDITLILAQPGKIYKVWGDLTYTEFKEYAVAGVGEMVGLGSLYSTTGLPRARVLTALRAASNYVPGCLPPFKICKLW